MARYAVDDIDDAVEATKTFLTPVDRSRWLRLAVVVLLVAGGLGFQPPVNAGAQVGTPDAVDLRSDELPTSPEAVLAEDTLVAVLASLVVAAIVLTLVLGFVGATMEFVFVESLRSDQVRVRRYFREYWGSGLRLFAFRLTTTLVGLLVVGAVAAVTFLTLFGGVPSSVEQALVGVLLLVPVLFVVFALVSLVDGFTTAFVVPVMLLEDRTVLGGWRRFWPTLRGRLDEYAWYVLMGFLLTLAVGIISTTIVGFGAMALAIPFVLVGGVVFVAGGATFSVPVLAVLGVLALVYVVLFLALVALVHVPLQTFMRSYTLFVLGDTNESFDAIPGLRATVRD